MTITRKDIKVEDVKGLDGNDYIRIDVDMGGGRSYGVTYKEGNHRQAAILALTEEIMKTEVGVTEHDIMMQVYDFEKKKKEQNEI